MSDDAWIDKYCRAAQRIADLESENTRLLTQIINDGESKRKVCEENQELKHRLNPSTPCEHELKDTLGVHCLKCNIAVLKRRNEMLEAQLAATKLKWQTGKPPKDGWYWVLFANKQWIGWYLESDMFFCGIEDQKNSCHWGECHWAGPLEPPEEE